MPIARRTLLCALAGTAALGAAGTPAVARATGLPGLTGSSGAGAGGPQGGTGGRGDRSGTGTGGIEGLDGSDGSDGSGSPDGSGGSGGSEVTGGAGAPGGPGGAAAAALARLLPRHHSQVTFRAVPRRGGTDAFRVSGTAGALLVEGATPAAQLTGFHWYLRHTAHAHFSWNGAQTALPDRLPGVRTPLVKAANVAHRFVFNDTNDSYAGPYRGWDYWEHEIDVLALHGFNEVLVYTGADAVYHLTFKEFGYSDTELREWLPGPAHQPWWLMQNMASFGGPVSPPLLARRPALARR
ncbi:alpha-N-acetylglucosaminidase TIM-barrel domain-containing protein, partial [Streptomyces sp. UNOC14_S4]|uniref:alpha-N-acetylglucosaminidase TIM-barrel domain-containing protein n=1 Tax=Streptomyces sp. UNOC14_S4 TaxID=2872340 RepID=UPI001E391643